MTRGRSGSPGGRDSPGGNTERSLKPSAVARIAVIITISSKEPVRSSAKWQQYLPQKMELPITEM